MYTYSEDKYERAVISRSLTRTDFYVEVLVASMLNLRIEIDDVT